METYNIESFFLDYANLVFDDFLDQNKQTEFEKKLSGLSSIADPDLLRQLTHALCKPHDLVANEGFAAVEELLRADSNASRGIPPTEEYESAEKKISDRIVFHGLRQRQQIVDAAYGYRDGYCDNSCDDRQLRRDLLGIGRFEGVDRLKCYECDQLFVKAILSQITHGDSFLEIQGFERLIAGQNDFIKSDVTILDDKLKEHLMLIDADFIISAQHDFPGTQRHFQYRNLITAFVSYSLRNFLMKKDRRKLKQCPVCSDFFIAKDTKRKLCYPPKDCKRVYRTPYLTARMREKYRNPDSDKFKSSYIR